MIFGIGCDIMEIGRINADNTEFVKRYFTEKEQDFLNSRKNKQQCIASNFTVKEAFSKALHTGVRKFKLSDVEVLRDELGCPYINLYSDAEKICRQNGITDIHVSISHTKELVTAYVILEKQVGK